MMLILHILGDIFPIGIKQHEKKRNHGEKEKAIALCHQLLLGNATLLKQTKKCKEIR